MSKPYSYDIRERAIKCFKQRMKYQDIASKLDLSLSTVKRYALRYRRLGDLMVKSEVRTGRKPKITDFDELRNFIKENNHLSLVDMANKWGISKSSLHRFIIKANFSFKKNRGYIEKVRKKRGRNLLK